MELATAIERLKASGAEQTRKTYRRHGARDPVFGVAFADLDRLAKEAKRDQALAQGLWETGNCDCRLLACMVADPAAVTEADLDAWLAAIDVYVLVDVFVGALASKVPGLRERADRWATSGRDWTSQAGWDLYTQMALKDDTLADAVFLGLLDRIEEAIGGAGNRTRHSMNAALIAIGVRNPALRAAAQAAAVRIGRIVIDHGQTGCVTPAALPYVDRTWARRTAKADTVEGARVSA